MGPPCLGNKAQIPKTGPQEGLPKPGHRASQLPRLSPAVANRTPLLQSPRSNYGSFSLLFCRSAWNMDAHPPSFTQTTPLPSDISPTRLSVNPGPHSRPLCVFPAPWKLRAQGHLFTALSSPLATAILESAVFLPPGLARAHTLSV